MFIFSLGPEHAGQDHHLALGDWQGWSKQDLWCKAEECSTRRSVFRAEAALWAAMLQPSLLHCSFVFLFVFNSEKSKAFKPSINWTLALGAMNYFLTEIHLPLLLRRNKLEEKNQLHRRGKKTRLCFRDKLLIKYAGNRHRML